MHLYFQTFFPIWRWFRYRWVGCGKIRKIQGARKGIVHQSNFRSIGGWALWTFSLGVILTVQRIKIEISKGFFIKTVEENQNVQIVSVIDKKIVVKAVCESGGCYSGKRKIQTIFRKVYDWEESFGH